MSEIGSCSNDLNVSIVQLLNDFCYTASATPSIYRVDDCLRNTNEKAYDPMFISIGPLHRGKSNLEAMELHKMRYLKQLLGDSTSVDIYVDAIRNLEQSAREFYAQEIGLDADQFVKMLLLDGIFIIEFLCEYRLVDGGEVKMDGNPIFGSLYVVSQLLRDLMLFENQIPMSIVEALFRLSNKDDKKEFKDLIWPLTGYSRGDVPNDANARHLLGLVHSVKCFSFAQLRSHEKCWTQKNINSATDLREAGIVIKKKPWVMGKDCSWLDITFKKRTLYIPELMITDETESWFKNMIAYEFYLPISIPKYVSDYLFFLHCLMSSSKDAEVLRRCGVISSWLGGDARVYEVIDRLGTHVFNWRYFSYGGVFESINDHCGSKWNRLRANLKNSGPVISFIASVALRLL